MLTAQFTGVALAHEAFDTAQVETTVEPQSIQTPPPPASLQVIETREAPRASKAAGPPAKIDHTRPAKARGERGWAVRILEAYPTAAKREGLEGTVALSVVVTPDGRASDCKVTQSSGHTIIDDAACGGMLRYARFEPALDKEGNPVSGIFRTRFTYYNQWG
jgi:protein TonB